MGSLDALMALGCLVALAATLRLVWRGGTTWNDHLVALFVALCMAVYPLSWVGARVAGVAGLGLFAALSSGVFGLWVLFHVLDQRREMDAWRPFVVLSQVAYAFALWGGLAWWLWWAGCAVGSVVDGGLLDLGTWMWPGGVLIVPLALSIWGTVWTVLAADQARVVKLDAWFGDRSLRVVHLSDLHCSPTTTSRDFARTATVVRSMAPDLIVVTGDLVMPFSECNHTWLLDFLETFEVPVVACAGNHDLPVADLLASELSARGITWLQDAQKVVEIGRPEGTLRVELVGVDFVWSDLGGHLDRLLDGLQPAADAHARLLLMHDPRGFDSVPSGRFDLVLSGHTHGGQVGTDMFGWPGSPLGWAGLYDQGLFEREGARLLVHRGNWHFGLPPRMGIATEVVAVDLMPRRVSTAAPATSPEAPSFR